MFSQTSDLPEQWEDDITEDNYPEYNSQLNSTLPRYSDEDYYEIDSYHSGMVNGETILMRVAFMFFNEETNTPEIKVIPIKIYNNNTYHQLVNYILQCLNYNIVQLHGYVMTTNGLMDLTNSQRRIREDFHLIPYNIRLKDARYHLLLFIANSNRVILSSRDMANPTEYKPLISDQIVSQGGPFVGQELRWIDLEDRMAIKIAIAPCVRCNGYSNNLYRYWPHKRAANTDISYWNSSKSGNSCYQGLQYSEIITIIEVEVSSSLSYFDLHQYLKVKLKELYGSTNFINRTLGNIPKAKEINRGEFYLFNGTGYYNLSEGTRMIYQDYYIWRNWADLSMNNDYGLYLHMCPPGLEASKIKYEQDLINRTVWCGGDPSGSCMRASFNPLSLQIQYVLGKTSLLE